MSDAHILATRIQRQPRTQWVFNQTGLRLGQGWTSRLHSVPDFTLCYPDNLLLLVLTLERERRKSRQMKKTVIRGGRSCVLACFILEEAPERSLRVGDRDLWAGAADTGDIEPVCQQCQKHLRGRQDKLSLRGCVF